MKRPLIYGTCYYIIGLLAGQYLEGFGIALFYVAVILSAILLIRKYRVLEPAGFVLMALIGVLTIGMAGQEKSLTVAAMAQTREDVQVSGVVTHKRQSSVGGWILTVTSEEIIGGMYQETRPLQLQAYGDQNVSVDVGDRIQFYGRINEPEPPSNPGDFDEEKYMKARGYDFTVYIDSPVEVTGEEEKFSYSIFHFREKLKQIYDELLPQQEAGIVKAIVLGEKSEMDPQVKELYRQAGISHILAISGLHITIITMIVFSLLHKVLGINRRVCSVVTMVFLLFYGTLTGWSASITRAVIMSFVVLVGNVIYREGDRLNSIALAALLILLVRPYYLWDAGFQMSFLSVIGICIGMSAIEDNPKVSMILKGGLGTSILVTLFTYPVVTWYYHDVSIVGVFVNIFVIPCLGAIVLFSMAAGLIGFICMPVATFLIGSVYLLLHFYELVSVTFTMVPNSMLFTGRLPIGYIVVYYVALIGILLHKAGSRVSQTIIFTALGALLLFGVANPAFLHKNKVVFLDVGQGDCAVIHTYDNQTILIDGGGNGYRPLGENTGANTVIPYLESQGIDTIDALFITHMDTDHAMGAIETMMLMNVEKCVISVEGGDNALYETLMEVAFRQQVPVYRMKQGSKVLVNESMYLECYYPFVTETVENQNHASLVLKLEDRGTTILFTGDVEAEDEKKLLESGADVSCDILKVSHHGSAGASTEAFLEETKAKEAIVSAGKNNTYGHPSPETVERLENQGMTVYNTAEHGAITIEITKSGYQMETMQKGE